MQRPPIRIRLSRAKGFNLQETSRLFNGREAIKVDRTNRFWGNPFKVGKHGDAEACIEGYAEYLDNAEKANPEKFREELKKLFDKNLACWCVPGEACHADFLLLFIDEWRKRHEYDQSQTA